MILVILCVIIGLLWIADAYLYEREQFEEEMLDREMSNNDNRSINVYVTEEKNNRKL